MQFMSAADVTLVSEVGFPEMMTLLQEINKLIAWLEGELMLQSKIDAPKAISILLATLASARAHQSRAPDGASAHQLTDHQSHAKSSPAMLRFELGLLAAH